jgi:hypothetical protein
MLLFHVAFLLLGIFLTQGITILTEENVVKEVNGVGGSGRAVLIEITRLSYGITAFTEENVVKQIDCIRRGNTFLAVDVTGGV